MPLRDPLMSDLLNQFLRHFYFPLYYQFLLGKVNAIHYKVPLGVMIILVGTNLLV